MTFAAGALALVVAHGLPAAPAGPIEVPVEVPIEVVVDGDVGDVAAVRSTVHGALNGIEAAVRAALGAGPPLQHRLPTVRVRRAFALAGAKAAASSPGVIELRAQPALDDATRAALTHEAAHQFLWSTCPASSADALFHEAFAVWASGEAPAWLEGEDYLSLPRAQEALTKNGLDSRAARRALARLIVEERGVPAALARRLRACADGAAVPRLEVAELAAHRAADVDVLLVLQRATGEVVLARGDVDQPLPFGSTLKPFVVAAARMAKKAPPVLPVRTTDPMWACPLAQGTRTLDVEAALLKSCNGYFLDWAKRDPDAARLGELGPLLVAYGLSALPDDMRQAIGVQATLTIAPRGLALAYRALSWARPDVVAVLTNNAERGTLAGRAELRGVAAKTGTVRGLGSAPDVGWLVAVTDDVVVVRARAGVTPQALVEDVATSLAELPRAARTVSVQTFGLLPPEQVLARCDDGGAVLSNGGVERVGAVPGSLSSWARQGATLCHGPWHVSFSDDARARPYHGVFTWSSPPEPAADLAKDPLATPRQLRARRGSDFVLQTSLGRYTAGVLSAEDSAIGGTARDALARVIAHNVLHADERHGGRPPCDTTHCQAFLGTGVGAAGTPQLAPLASKVFLTFSKGGTEPWRAQRSLAEWRAALQERLRLDGGEVRVVRVQDGALALLVRSAAGDAEEVIEVACEPLRSALRLPACPTSVAIVGTRVRFQGSGLGHGLGLDVERAKAAAAAGASAEALLVEAYGAAVLGRR
ncbi:MAG: hypothetical protein HYS27_24070 [Deltaproteobacteria bacterium]|nr:hypothetical protein [Deltaproteobacteria bacterium]